MVWRSDTNSVYVLCNDDTYEVYPGSVVPQGYFTDPLHKGAFGYYWTTDKNIRSRISDPTDIEFLATDFAVQDFANGTIFYFYQNETNNYVLFNATKSWLKRQE